MELDLGGRVPATPTESVVDAVDTDETLRPERTLVRGSPTYVLRLVTGAAVTIVGAFLAWRFSNAAAGAGVDGESIVDDLPSWLRYGPLVILVVIYLLLPIVVNILLIVRRRWRLLAGVNLAAFAAIVVSDVFARLVVDTEPSGFPNAYVVDGQTINPNNPMLAASVAALVVGLPYLGRGIRRLALIGIAFDLVVTLLFSELPTVTWPLDLGLGITVGAGIALLFGTPDRKPNGDDIAAVLSRSGIDIAAVNPAAVDARGSSPWFATSVTGSRLFVKVLNSDNRSADLLFRLGRFIRLRHTGDERPFGSLRRTVEHEALLSLRASSVDIRTPRLLAVSEIGTDGMLLAYEAVAGRSLDSVAADEITDDVLDGVWSLVREMRATGIAHRDLRLANIFLGEDGLVWMIDFGFAELAASDLLLDTDVAELLASTAPEVGVERAVDAAERGIGLDALRDALPRIQPLALGSATKATLKSTHLLEPLRDAVRVRCGVDQVDYEELARVKPKTVLSIVVATAAMWFLIPQIADARGALAQIGDADWWYMLLAVIASLVTYLGAALGMMGSIRDPLPLGATVYAQLASSFSNRITPAKVGGMAVNVRYLQKQGVDTPIALSAVGINTVTGAVVHLALLGIALQVARHEGDVHLSLPSSMIIFIILAIAAALAGTIMLVPKGRKLFINTLWPAVRKAINGLRDIAHRPSRLIELFGGSILTTFAYIGALAASVRAMGGDTPMVSIALVFLTGSIVATAAPTPGGLGAAEAAFIAGLTASGESSDVAIPAVFLYRLATFWLPILPGWLAFHRLQATNRI